MRKGQLAAATRHRLQSVLRYDGALLVGSPVLAAFLFSSFHSFDADAATVPSPAAFGVGAFAMAAIRRLGRHKTDLPAPERAERRYRTPAEHLSLATYFVRVFDSKVVYVAPQIERLLVINGRAGAR